jgi:hypothetical protein
MITQMKQRLMKPSTPMQSSFRQRQLESHHHHLLSKTAIVRLMDGVTTKPLTARATVDAILIGAMVTLLQIVDKLSASVVVRRAT